MNRPRILRHGQLHAVNSVQTAEDADGTTSPSVLRGDGAHQYHLGGFTAGGVAATFTAAFISSSTSWWPFFLAIFLAVTREDDCHLQSFDAGL